MARLFLNPGETSPFKINSADPANEVFGTNNAETVDISADGDVIFDATFNKGGDTINIEANADTYDGALVGTRLVITSDAGAFISIPVGDPTTISFTDGSYTLEFNGTNIVLGAQIITNNPEPLDDLEAIPALSASFGDIAPEDGAPPVDSNVLNLG